MSDDPVIDLSIPVPGSPTEVWRAVATGPGIGSWFVPAQVEEHVGGSVTLDFGDLGSAAGRVTAWEPPFRFAYEDEADDEATGLSYEWLVEETDTQACTVRLVNRGFAHGDDPDPDLEGMEGGWPVFLQNLRLHLTHFPGLAARAITPTVMVPGGNAAAWAALCEALGVEADLGEGAHFTTSGEGAPMLIGTIESVVSIPGRVTAYVLLVEAPAAGTAFLAVEGDGDQVACSVWLYLYDVDADEVEDRWTPFLNQRWGSVPAA
jgi:uncharacterized protein YndB with AHSA1/START domain